MTSTILYNWLHYYWCVGRSLLLSSTCFSHFTFFLLDEVSCGPRIFLYMTGYRFFFEFFPLFRYTSQLFPFLSNSLLKCVIIMTMEAEMLKGFLRCVVYITVGIKGVDVGPLPSKNSLSNILECCFVKMEMGSYVSLHTFSVYFPFLGWCHTKLYS